MTDNRENEFFRRELTVTVLHHCVKVSRNTGKTYHPMRSSHGLIYQLSGEETYSFFKPSPAEKSQKPFSETVFAGELFYLPKFSGYRVKPSPDCACIAVNFDISDSQISFPFFKLTPFQSQKLMPLLEKLLFLSEKSPAGYRTRSMSVLYELLFELQTLPREESGFSPRQNQLVQSCREIIDREFSDNKLTVGEIAGRLSVSPEYLRRVFLLCTGSSPKKALTAKRMEYAEKLILSGEVRLTEIFCRCGYDSPGYFASEFKRITGMTPGQYRKERRVHSFPASASFIAR